jgi:hypothetical protein
MGDSGLSAAGDLLAGHRARQGVVSGINDLNLIERLASVVALEHEAFGVLVAERSGRRESLGAERAV